LKEEHAALGEAGRAALVAAEGRIVAALKENEERIRTLKVSICVNIYMHIDIEKERERET